MDIEVLQHILAIITLGLGAALIIYIFDAYKTLKQKSLLLLIYGLFILIIGVVLPDITGILAADIFWQFWSALFSRLLVIIGICVIIYSIVRG
jgi:hypothetical protein